MTQGKPLAGAVRFGIVALFVINSAFIAVDWIGFRDRLWDFLPVRLALDVILGWLYFRESDRRPVLSVFATIYCGAWMLFTVVLGTGGTSSPYYVGLVLLFMGTGVIEPLSARQAAIALCSLLAAYALLPLVEKNPVELHAYLLHLFFLGAAALVGVVGCASMDRLRFADYLKRKELEGARDKLAELDRQKSRFTANVHHELRTPLTLMLAPLDMLLGGDLGELRAEQRSYLATARENGLRLLKLINQLLDLARIESRQKELDRLPLDPGALARRILDSARPLAERKGVALEGEGLDRLPVIHADADALETVLVNLLGNALKFTEHGGRIALRGKVAAEGVRFTVEDTGIGIPQEQLGRVFDRFAQVDASATRKHEGTGIGLALVKELVELHGGSVGVESEGVGQGSRFRVVLPFGTGTGTGEGEAGAEEVVCDPQGRGLPLEEAFAAVGAQVGLGTTADAPPPEAAEDYHVVDLRRSVELAETAAETPGLGAPTQARDERPSEHPDERPEVLVVEDNGDMRRLLAFLLGREFRVRLAENGRRGLEAVHERAPDLVLSDVMMPEMSGLELCASLKQDGATRGIPLVLVTSKAQREQRIEGLELGADDYVLKPFHPRELLARVRSLVTLRRSRVELEQTLEALQQTTAQLVHSERLAAVGEMAAGVVHEVNNPVNYAINAARAMSATVDDVRKVAEQVAALEADEEGDELRRQLEALETLRESLQFDESAATLTELAGIVTDGLDRVATLVGELRDFARPGERERGPVDLARCLQTTLHLMGHTLTRSGVEIHSELPPTLPQVEGDARALNQVLLNVLKNAAEAFEEGGGSIWIRGSAEADEVVTVTILDDGPGIPAEVRKKLFQPFFTTKRERGTGLGLSISRRIVEEQHGGTFELHSEPGEGTRVRLTIPVRSPGNRGPSSPV